MEIEIRPADPNSFPSSAEAMLLFILVLALICIGSACARSGVPVLDRITVTRRLNDELAQSGQVTLVDAHSSHTNLFSIRYSLEFSVPVQLRCIGGTSLLSNSDALSSFRLQLQDPSIYAQYESGLGTNNLVFQLPSTMVSTVWQLSDSSDSDAIFTSVGPLQSWFWASKSSACSRVQLVDPVGDVVSTGSASIKWIQPDSQLPRDVPEQQNNSVAVDNVESTVVPPASTVEESTSPIESVVEQPSSFWSWLFPSAPTAAVRHTTRSLLYVAPSIADSTSFFVCNSQLVAPGSVFNCTLTPCVAGVPQSYVSSPYPYALGLSVQPPNAAVVSGLQLSADGQNWTVQVTMANDASGLALTLSDGVSALPVYVPIVQSLATPLWVQSGGVATFVVVSRDEYQRTYQVSSSSLAISCGNAGLTASAINPSFGALFFVTMTAASNSTTGSFTCTLTSSQSPSISPISHSIFVTTLPDATSTISCNTTSASQGAVVGCTLQTNVQSSPAYVAKAALSFSEGSSGPGGIFAVATGGQSYATSFEFTYTIPTTSLGGFAALSLKVPSAALPAAYIPAAISPSPPMFNISVWVVPDNSSTITCNSATIAFDKLLRCVLAAKRSGVSVFVNSTAFMSQVAPTQWLQPFTFGNATPICSSTPPGDATVLSLGVNLASVVALSNGATSSDSVFGDSIAFDINITNPNSGSIAATQSLAFCPGVGGVSAAIFYSMIFPDNTSSISFASSFGSAGQTIQTTIVLRANGTAIFVPANFLVLKEQLIASGSRFSSFSLTYGSNMGYQTTMTVGSGATGANLFNLTIPASVFGAGGTEQVLASATFDVVGVLDGSSSLRCDPVRIASTNSSATCTFHGRQQSNSVWASASQLNPQVVTLLADGSTPLAPQCGTISWATSNASGFSLPFTVSTPSNKSCSIIGVSDGVSAVTQWIELFSPSNSSSLYKVPISSVLKFTLLPRMVSGSEVGSIMSTSASYHLADGGCGGTFVIAPSPVGSAFMVSWTAPSTPRALCVITDGVSSAGRRVSVYTNADSTSSITCSLPWVLQGQRVSCWLAPRLSLVSVAADPTQFALTVQLAVGSNLQLGSFSALTPSVTPSSIFNFSYIASNSGVGRVNLWDGLSGSVFVLTQVAMPDYSTLLSCVSTIVQVGSTLQCTIIPEAGNVSVIAPNVFITSSTPPLDVSFSSVMPSFGQNFTFLVIPGIRTGSVSISVGPSLGTPFTVLIYAAADQTSYLSCPTRLDSGVGAQLALTQNVTARSAWLKGLLPRLGQPLSAGGIVDWLSAPIGPATVPSSGICTLQSQFMGQPAWANGTQFVISVGRSLSNGTNVTALSIEGGSMPVFSAGFAQSFQFAINSTATASCASVSVVANAASLPALVDIEPPPYTGLSYATVVSVNSTISLTFTPRRSGQSLFLLSSRFNFSDGGAGGSFQWPANSPNFSTQFVVLYTTPVSTGPVRITDGFSDSVRNLLVVALPDLTSSISCSSVVFASSTGICNMTGRFNGAPALFPGGSMYTIVSADSSLAPRFQFGVVFASGDANSTATLASQFSVSFSVTAGTSFQTALVDGVSALASNITVFVRQDSTSSFTCDKVLLQVGTALTCSIINKVSGVTQIGHASFANASTAPLSIGTSSPVWSISAITPTVSTAMSFTFTPSAGSGWFNVTDGVSASLFSLQLWSNPDITSYIVCDFTVIFIGMPVNCTAHPQVNGVPEYTLKAAVSLTTETFGAGSPDGVGGNFSSLTPIEHGISLHDATNSTFSKSFNFTFNATSAGYFCLRVNLGVGFCVRVPLTTPPTLPPMLAGTTVTLTVAPIAANGTAFVSDFSTTYASLTDTSGGLSSIICTSATTASSFTVSYSAPPTAGWVVMTDGRSGIATWQRGSTSTPYLQIPVYLVADSSSVLVCNGGSPFVLTNGTASNGSSTCVFTPKAAAVSTYSLVSQFSFIASPSSVISVIPPAAPELMTSITNQMIITFVGNARGGSSTFTAIASSTENFSQTVNFYAVPDITSVLTCSPDVEIGKNASCTFWSRVVNASTWTLSTLLRPVDSHSQGIFSPFSGLYDQMFTFTFTAGLVSGSTNISLGAHLPVVSIWVWQRPDNTSIFTCDDKFLVNSPGNCTFAPMANGIGIMSNSALFSMFDSGSGGSFSVTPVFSYNYSIVFTAGSTTGYQSIGLRYLAFDVQTFSLPRMVLPSLAQWFANGSSIGISPNIVTVFNSTTNLTTTHWPPELPYLTVYVPVWDWPDASGLVTCANNSYLRTTSSFECRLQCRRSGVPVWTFNWAIAANDMSSGGSFTTMVTNSSAYSSVYGTEYTFNFTSGMVTGPTMLAVNLSSLGASISATTNLAHFQSISSIRAPFGYGMVSVFDQPDGTSTFVCPPTPYLLFLARNKVCTIYPAKNGAPIWALTSMYNVTASVPYLVRPSINSTFFSNFTLIDNQLFDIGTASVDIGIPGVAAAAFQMFNQPDNSTYITCAQLHIPIGGTVACTFYPQLVGFAIPTLASSLSPAWSPANPGSSWSAFSETQLVNTAYHATFTAGSVSGPMYLTDGVSANPVLVNVYNVGLAPSNITCVQSQMITGTWQTCTIWPHRAPGDTTYVMNTSFTPTCGSSVTCIFASTNQTYGSVFTFSFQPTTSGTAYVSDGVSAWPFAVVVTDTPDSSSLLVCAQTLLKVNTNTTCTFTSRRIGAVIRMYAVSITATDSNSGGSTTALSPAYGSAFTFSVTVGSTSGPTIISVGVGNTVTIQVWDVADDSSTLACSVDSVDITAGAQNVVCITTFQLAGVPVYSTSAMLGAIAVNPTAATLALPSTLRGAGGTYGSVSNPSTNFGNSISFTYRTGTKAGSFSVTVALVPAATRIDLYYFPDSTSSINCTQYASISASVTCLLIPRSTGLRIYSAASKFTLSDNGAGGSFASPAIVGEMGPIGGVDSFGINPSFVYTSPSISRSVTISDGRSATPHTLFVLKPWDSTSTLSCSPLIVRIGTDVSCSFVARNNAQPTYYIAANLSLIVARNSTGQLVATSNGVFTPPTTPYAHVFNFTLRVGSTSGPFFIRADPNVAPVAISVYAIPDATSYFTCRDPVFLSGTTSCTINPQASGQPIYALSAAFSPVLRAPQWSGINGPPNTWGSLGAVQGIWGNALNFSITASDISGIYPIADNGLAMPAYGFRVYDLADTTSTFSCATTAGGLVSSLAALCTVVARQQNIPIYAVPASFVAISQPVDSSIPSSMNLMGSFSWSSPFGLSLNVSYLPGVISGYVRVSIVPVSSFLNTSGVWTFGPNNVNGGSVCQSSPFSNSTVYSFVSIAFSTYGNTTTLSSASSHSFGGSASSIAAVSAASHQSQTPSNIYNWQLSFPTSSEVKMCVTRPADPAGTWSDTLSMPFTLVTMQCSACSWSQIAVYGIPDQTATVDCGSNITLVGNMLQCTLTPQRNYLPIFMFGHQLSWFARIAQTFTSIPGTYALQYASSDFQTQFIANFSTSPTFTALAWLSGFEMFPSISSFSRHEVGIWDRPDNTSFVICLPSLILGGQPINCLINARKNNVAISTLPSQYTPTFSQPGSAITEFSPRFSNTFKFNLSTSSLPSHSGWFSFADGVTGATSTYQVYAVPDSTSVLVCSASQMVVGSSITCNSTAMVNNANVYSIWSAFSPQSAPQNGSTFEGVVNVASSIVATSASFGTWFSWSFTAGSTTGNIILTDSVSGNNVTIFVYAIPDSTSTLICTPTQDIVTPIVFITSTLSCQIFPRVSRSTVYALASLFTPTATDGYFTISTVLPARGTQFTVNFTAGTTTSSIIYLKDGVSANRVSAQITSSGTISLSNYGPLTNQQWPITLPASLQAAGWYIGVMFNSMNIEDHISRALSSRSCKYDNVSILFSNGSTAVALCGGGTSIPHDDSPVTVKYWKLGFPIRAFEGPSISVQFLSDKTNQFDGFEMLYQFLPTTDTTPMIPVQPPGRTNFTVLTSETGNITWFKYHSADNQTWVIDMTRYSCSIVQVRFSSFDVEDDPVCIADAVRIYEGISVTSTPKVTLCGSGTSSYHTDMDRQMIPLLQPFSSTATSNGLVVTFLADLINTYPGFAFSWTSSIPFLAVDATPIVPIRIVLGAVLSATTLPASRITEPRGATLTYAVTFSSVSGIGQPVWLIVDPVAMTVRTNGEVPRTTALDTYTLTITATSPCGYSASVNQTIGLYSNSPPDETSTLTCSPDAITLPIGAANVPQISCIISAKNSTIGVVTTVSVFNAFVQSGAGSLTTLTSDAPLSDRFTFSFLPAPSGGISVIAVTLLSGASLNFTVTVFGTPDITSVVACASPTAVSFQVILCQIAAMSAKMPIYATYPFSLKLLDVTSRGSQLPPYVLQSPKNSILPTFSMITQTNSSTFLFNVTLGDIGGIYKIGIGGDTSATIIVVQKSDASSILTCDGGRLSASSTLQCCVTPRIKQVKTYSLATDFAIATSTGTATGFTSVAGSRICFQMSAKKIVLPQSAPTASSALRSADSMSLPHVFKSADFLRSVQLSSDPMSLKSVELSSAGIHQFLADASSASLNLNVDGQTANGVTLKLQPAPDSTTSIVCSKSVYRGASSSCVISARLAGSTMQTLAASFTPVAVRGQATFGPVSLYRQTGSVDTLASTFTFTFTASTTTGDLTITDSVSGTSAFVVVLVEPLDVRMMTCVSGNIYLSTGASQTCTFSPTAFGLTIGTFANRFEASIVNNVGGMGSLVQPLPVMSGNNTDASAPQSQFQFSYTAPSTAMKIQVQLKVSASVQGVLQLSATRTFSIVVFAQADSTSQFSCVSSVSGVAIATAYASLMCRSIAMNNGVPTFTSAAYFKPAVISGLGTFSIVSPAASNVLTFTFTPGQPYSSAVISDGLSSNYITVSAVPPARALTWAPASAFPSSLILPTLGRATGSMLTSLAPLQTLPSGVNGNERFVSVSCSQVYCAAATAEGSVLTWGTLNQARLGRTDTEGSTYVPAGWVHGPLDLVAISAVSVIETYPFDSSQNGITVALAKNGSLYMWGDATGFNAGPVLINLPNYTFDLISSKGAIGLAATADDQLFSWSAQSSVFFLGRPGLAGTPQAVTLGSYQPSGISLLLGATRYAIAVANDATDGSMIYSWGSGLELTDLPSDSTIGEYNFTSAIYQAFPSGGSAPFIQAIDGSDTAIMVIENDRQCVLNKICTRPPRLFWMSLDLGSLHSRQWELIVVPLFANRNIINIAVGLETVLLSDDNGAAWQFSVSPQQSMPYMLAEALVISPGSDISLLFSHLSQFAALSAPTIKTDPTVDVVACGTTSFQCPSLSVAMARFTMTGTNFLLQPGVYYDSNMASSVSDIQIKGDGPVGSVTINCMGQSCFNLRGPSNMINNLIIVNGSGTTGGCLSVPPSVTMTIINSQFIGCSSSSYGGAVFVSGLSNLTVLNTTFSSNKAGAGGGGMYVSAYSMLTMNGSTFSGNNAVHGAGLAFSRAFASVSYSTFSGNVATLRGGGIDSAKTSIALASSTVQKNVAPAGAGVNLQDSTATLSSSQFIGNVAQTTGGALYVGFSTTSIIDCAFLSNIVTGALTSSGAGLYCLGQQSFQIKSSLFSSNVASYQGGALALIFCSPIINLTTISNNSANEGGAVFTGLQAVSTVLNSTITGNSAFSAGGAFTYQYSSPSYISYSVVSNNSAGARGGAMHTVGVVQVNVDNSRMTLNSAPAGGAVWWSLSAPTLSDSTVLSDNTASQGPDQASDARWLLWINALNMNGAIFSSGVLTDQTLVVGLYDYYYQLITVENSTSLSLTGVQSTNPMGITSAQIIEGVATFNSWGLVYRPNATANFNIQGFFPAVGVGLLTTIPNTQVPLRLCVPGEYVLGGDRCSPCLPGTYSNISMATTCLTCSPGYFQSNSSKTSCIACAAGTFTPEYRSTQCAACLKGQFTNSTGFSTCSNCLPGTYASFTGLTVCNDCPPGQYAFLPMQEACNLCAPGYYTSTNGTKVCPACPTGMYQSVSGSSSCMFCNPGQMPDRSIAADGCQICPPGTYMAAPKLGKAECDTCPANSGANVDNTNFLCKPNYYAVPQPSNKTLCLACPPGADCTQAGTTLATVLPLVGWAPDITHSNLSFIQCLNTACGIVTTTATTVNTTAKARVIVSKGFVSGNSTNSSAAKSGTRVVMLSASGLPISSNPNCAPGYDGALCTECMPGMGRTGLYDCSRCPDAETNNIHVLFGALVLMAFSVFMVYSSITQLKSDLHSAILQLIVESVSFNAMVAGVSITWPDSIKTLLSYMTTMTNIVTNFIQLDCFMYENYNNLSDPNDPNFFFGDMPSSISPFYLKSLVYAALPIACIFFPMLLFFPIALFQWLRARWTNQSEEDVQKARRVPIKMYFCTVIVLVYLLHAEIVDNTMHFFACIQLGLNADDMYLLADLGQKCHTPTHSYWMWTVGVPCLIAYVIGIPAIFIAVLWKYQPRQVIKDARDIREQIRVQEAEQRKYDKMVEDIEHQLEHGLITARPELPPRPQITVFRVPRSETRILTNFLQVRFKPQFFFWKAVTIVRMVFMSCFIVYYTGHAQQQLLLATGLAFIALIAQLIFAPYVDNILNVFEFVSLFISFVEFYLALYLTVNDVSASGKAVIAGLMVFCAAAFIIVCLLFFFYGLYVSRRARAQTEAAIARGELVFDDDADEDEEGAEIVDPEKEKLEALAKMTWRDADDSVDAEVSQVRSELDEERRKQEKILKEVLGKKADRLKRFSSSLSHSATLTSVGTIDSIADVTPSELQRIDEDSSNSDHGSDSMSSNTSHAADAKVVNSNVSSASTLPPVITAHSAAETYAGASGLEKRRAVIPTFAAQTEAPLPDGAIRFRLTLSSFDIELVRQDMGSFRVAVQSDLCTGLTIASERINVLDVEGSPVLPDSVRVVVDLLPSASAATPSAVYTKLQAQINDPNSAVRHSDLITHFVSSIELLTPERLIARMPSVMQSKFVSHKPQPSLLSDPAIRCVMDLHGFDARAVRSDLPAFQQAFAADLSAGLKVDPSRFHVLSVDSSPISSDIMLVRFEISGSSDHSAREIYETVRTQLADSNSALRHEDLITHFSSYVLLTDSMPVPAAVPLPPTIAQLQSVSTVASQGPLAALFAPGPKK